MPIPKLKSGQSEKDFVSKCISKVHDIDPGKYTNKQVVAICYSQYRKGTIKEKMGSIKDLSEKEIFYIDKGLTREEARKRTISKIKKDHRGFKYDPDTGKCVYI